MQKSHFPGYSQCIACDNLISEKSTRDHILVCGQKSSKDKQVCECCQKQMNSKEYEQHILICKRNTSLTTTKKQCPICNKSVEDLAQHCLICTNEETDNTSYQTPRAQSPVQSDEINSNNKQTKSCLLCNQQIDQSDYENHITNCSTSKTDFVSEQDFSSKQINQTSDISKREKTKICDLCSNSFDSSEYENHLRSCSNKNLLNNSTSDSQTSAKQSSSMKNSSLKEKQKRICMLCSQEIAQYEFQDHVQTCSNQQQDSTNDQNNFSRQSSFKNSSTTKTKTTRDQDKKEFCSFCSKYFKESEYNDHIQSCSDKDSISTKNFNRKPSKISCVICFQSIDPFDYDSHVEDCATKQNNVNHKKKSSKKKCIVCSESIDNSQYKEHVEYCASQTSPTIQINSNNQTTTTNQFFHDNNQSLGASSTNNNKKSKRDCILCFQSIDASEYESHVLACLAQTEQQSSHSTTEKNVKCLTCNNSIDKENEMYCETSCDNHHKHCFKCLISSMEEFARNNETPVCHKTLCDYKLSLYDISLMPIQRRLSDRLLKLVQGKQRPLCDKCHFYVDINDIQSFDRHTELCDDLIPCEYCQCPYPFQQLEIHATQCANENTSQNEKLINFLLSRTKYPFPKEQIRIYIQEQRKTSIYPLDPLTIVQSLAVFGETFPYEIPKRECEICLESYPYDDIYVFDCDDSHKLCYQCYYQSCQTKMNNGEMLTCAVCTHPLKDGELNQLRIEEKELKKIRDYQMKKTFDIYSTRTRGIIKCPNQNCSWIAEAADPNERFKVQCPQCHKEFCSLCNQQYHYRTTCQQLPQITQRWFFWCQNERQRYLTVRAQKDKEYKSRLDNYNQQYQQNEQRNNELRRRYDELINDEQYKAQNCRLCPNCKRVVQRLEGCDSMICGQDAHGGNVQSGCGHKFNWAQARPYTPSTSKQPKQTIIDLPKPENPIVHHEGVKCDHCQNDVNGIRFDCVHCPTLTFCEKCEQQATLDHSTENQFMGQQQHVFKLIMEPQEEATFF